LSQLGVGAFASVLLVAVAASAVAEDASKLDPTAVPIDAKIQVSPGDSWTYDLRDDVTGDVKGSVVFEVTKAADGEIETRTTRQMSSTNAKTTTVQRFDARWRRTDNGKYVWRPHLDTSGVPDALQIGKSWSFKFEALRKGSAQTEEYAGVGKVEAWERVTLPNGAAYDAFKIDVADTQTSGSGLAGRKHENHAVMWFAPAVNRLVKMIDESRDNGKLRDATVQTLREYKPAAK
jgi:hypothetical protein